MFSDGMDPDWRPSPPPEVGSGLWKYTQAVSWAIQTGKLNNSGLTQRIYRCPTVSYEGVVYDLGYIAVKRLSNGYDYIWAETIE